MYSPSWNVARDRLVMPIHSCASLAVFTWKKPRIIIFHIFSAWLFPHGVGSSERTRPKIHGYFSRKSQHLQRSNISAERLRFLVPVAGKEGKRRTPFARM